ncbi:MAG: hypothetical protein AMXMBFR7_01080 [Planctomycetota bacterium]
MNRGMGLCTVGMLCALLACGAAPFLSGCRGGSNDAGAALREDPEQKPGEQAEKRETEKPAEPKGEAPRMPAWEGRTGSGDAVTLRARVPVGKVHIYEVRVERSQAGENRFTETGDFYLTYAAMDRTPENMTRIAIRRTYLDRSRKEIHENKKVVDSILLNTDTLLNLGPNSDFVAQQRCYAFDDQNRIAYRSEDLVLLEDGRIHIGIKTKEDEDSVTLETTQGTQIFPRLRVKAVQKIPTPHILHDDTPHYLFPIFSARAVAPGDSWAFRVPVIVPLEQPDAANLLPTQFDARLEGRLREVRGQGDNRVAVVEYRFAGAFDSNASEYLGRFSESFRERNRLLHALEGSGTATVQVASGRILEKTETFTIRMEASSVVPQENNQPPKQEEKKVSLTSTITMRLLPPGTVLRSGVKVPSWDE